MSQINRRILFAVGIVLASGVATELAAQDVADETACARLLPAIESLKAMLVQESQARTVDAATQRTQLVMTLLGLRYHNIEALESSLRSAESEETEVRGSLARTQAQTEAFDEAARNAAAPPDPERRAARAELDAIQRGLEERAKALRERKASTQGQLALERHDIEKLESMVRAWIEKAP